jgi:hypothetical protein
MCRQARQLVRPKSDMTVTSTDCPSWLAPWITSNRRNALWRPMFERYRTDLLGLM